ncbi:FAD-dependent oxidoreductase [Leifsonia shinshuensis]|uniref:FAD-dependent oxidoreductase n=1 Tax=Leifsonia shinshuensis TaxID=150026 RepID=UPI00285492CE|nr:FAD-dependent oxidoreductase [Leifsonia shinshuensis]MDR6972069.1 assimilatory nitrate reductase electron transfer subunit [Leifsonia shinshuensis]
MTARPLRVVLVGYGPVGARFVEELLPAVAAGEASLTVVGAEREDAYNRVLVAEYAVGAATRERLEVTDTAAAELAGADIRLGDVAVAIDRPRQRVLLASGDELPYDRLVLATGARANIPTLDGLEHARRDRSAAPAHALDQGLKPLPTGVVALRDLADAEAVAPVVAGGGTIVVLGAGVLGMEFALLAAEHGAHVVIVHHGPVPMARNLDEAGGRMLARATRALGVGMAAHARAETIGFRDDRAGRVFDGVGCADGTYIPGDLLVLSCGVAARTELALAAGLACSSGILVDEELRSWSDPDVFAIGDCAQVASPDATGADGRVPGAPSGLIGPGWRQAAALAGRFRAEASGGVAGPDAAVPRRERPIAVMLKATGIDVVSGGDYAAEPWELDAEVSVWLDPARTAYLKTVVRDGVLAGFVSVGLPRAGAELTLLFERAGTLPAEPSTFLRLDAPDAGQAPVEDPLGPDATVCWCNGVTAGRIGEAVAGGCGTVEAVGRETRAGTGCGGCKGRIASLLAAAQAVPN